MALTFLHLSGCNATVVLSKLFLVRSSCLVTQYCEIRVSQQFTDCFKGMLVTVWFQFPKLQIFDSTPRWQQAKTCPPSSWCWWGTEALVGSSTSNKLISCVLVVSFLEIQLLFFRKDNFREAPSDWRVWEEIRGNPWSGGEAILQYECQQFCTCSKQVAVLENFFHSWMS